MGGSASAPDASPADGRLALLAAGAVSHVLQHSSLSHLWTSAPDSLSYLERLSEEEAAELVALPISLAKEGVSNSSRSTTCDPNSICTHTHTCCICAKQI